MPWIEALLRGQKVLARAKDDGSFEARDGRVEIRYRPTDARAYRASAGNLTLIPGATVLPDSTCVESDSVSRFRKESDPAVLLDRPWIAFTDGACSGNPGPAGAGIVVISPAGKIDEGYQYLGMATNNIAELTAILLALAAIPKDAKSVVIHSDSKYAIGVISQGWKAKANPELVETIRRAASDRSQLKFIYVPGHSGVPMNERADELAREAIQTERTQTIRISE